MFPQGQIFTLFHELKIISTLDFFLTSPEYRYSLAGSIKLIKNICSGPIFQDKWLWIGPFPLLKSNFHTFSWIVNYFHFRFLSKLLQTIDIHYTGSMKIIKSICSGPIFQDYWLWIDYFHFFSFFLLLFSMHIKNPIVLEKCYTPVFQTKQTGVLNLTFICAKFEIS